MSPYQQGWAVRAKFEVRVGVHPYINHLLEVATLVAEATEGKDPELAADDVPVT